MVTAGSCNSGWVPSRGWYLLVTVADTAARGLVTAGNGNSGSSKAAGTLG
jgi:hypothetical protein